MPTIEYSDQELAELLKDLPDVDVQSGIDPEIAERLGLPADIDFCKAWPFVKVVLEYFMKIAPASAPVIGPVIRLGDLYYRLKC